MRSLIMIAAIAALGLTSEANAQATTTASTVKPTGLTCQAVTVPISGLPAATTPDSLDTDPFEGGPSCTDAPGLTFKVVSVSKPATLLENNWVRINHPLHTGSSVSFTYTVSDSSGATAVATVTVTRN